MKHLLILLTAVCLITACNNSPKNEGGGGLFGGDKPKNGGGDAPAKGKWSSADRDKFMKDCNGSMGDGVQNGSQICACVLEKMEKEYASMADADRLGGEAAGVKAAQECMNATGYKTDDNPPNITGDDDNNNGGGATWTAQQKQTFVNQCVPSAQQAQGLNSQQANSYCECMVNKIAARFSYVQANRLTAEELQKQEWQQAMMDCRPGTDY